MRKFLMAALLLAGAAFAQSPRFFVQLTDPQFGMYTNNKDFAQETANFEFAIATLNRLKPAFVVITGDLVNKPGDPAQIAEYKRILAKLDPSIPAYSVAGNHDVGNDPTPESLSVYREHLGRDYYSFRSGDLAGIVLDSCLQKAPAKAPAEAAKQEEWLRAELAKLKSSGAKHIVLFQHHPLFLGQAGEKEEYFNLPVETRRRLLALLHQYGVEWAFTGHHHRNGEARDGNLRVIVNGPIGKPLAGQSGMRIVQVKPTGIEHKYYELGDLPAVVQ